MRQIFTSKDANARGLTRATLRWGEQPGKWRKIIRGPMEKAPEYPVR